jgi:hypothetical protein
MALAQAPGDAGPLTAPPQGVTLTGQWVLDPEQSDDPDEVVQNMKGVPTDDTGPVGGPTGPGQAGRPRDPQGREPPSGPGVDVMTPGVTGGVGGGDPLRRTPSGSKWPVPRAAYGYLLDLPQTLTIAQRPSLILIQDDDDEGRTRGLRPDGVRRRSPDGAAETRTRWEDAGLHVETWRDDGVHVDELFELGADGSLLSVTLNVAESGVTLDVERVFRRSGSDDR